MKILEYEKSAKSKKGLTFPMHKLTNKQYEAYMKMLRDKEEGRLLTPDGLRLICSANEYDPEKIGLHMLTVLANWNKVEV